MNINAIKNLKLIDFNKYQKYISQIRDKINKLYKNSIIIFKVFIKHFQKIYNNKNITKNIIIKNKIILK